MNAVVAEAWRSLPFYRELWQARGFEPATIRSAADYAARVPLCTKLDLVRAFQRAGTARIGIEAVGSQPISNLVMTSGTRGFHTFVSLTAADLDGASRLAQARELWTMGVRPGMRVLSLSPAWHALGLQEARALEAIGAVPVLAWGTVSPRFVGNVLAAVRSGLPAHVLVTARVLRMLMAECVRLGIDAAHAFASVRYVGCAGEALSSAYRQRLRDRLGVEDLFERGGSSEGMFGGAECEAHRGHHISADVHYVEIVDPRSGELLAPGQRGTAVVTNLTLGRSLYLRFDTEDVAEIVPGACPCGRTHPVVEFYGRLADSVVLPDRIIAPADVREVLDLVPELEAMAFTLAAAGDGSVRLVVGEERPPTALEGAEALLASHLRVPVRIERAGQVREGWKGRHVA